MKSDIGTIIFLTAAVVFAFLLLLAARGGLFRRKMTKPGGNGLAHLLAPSIMGGVLCILCLCGTSWAWFTASVSTAATTIQTAAYTVSVTVTPEVTPTTENEFDLAAGGTYEITLTPTGTAKTGFCKISLETKTYYTGQLTSGKLTFTVNAGSGGKLTVTPEWGTCAVSSPDNTISNGDTIGEPAPLPAESPDSAPAEPTEAPTEPPADTTPETGEE